MYQKLTYEMEEVIKDHVEGLYPRIYSCRGSVIILTPEGKLYGLGKNESGKFGNLDQDDCETPVLIAENVKSAALSSHYVVYVTLNGELVILGNGALADRVSLDKKVHRVVSVPDDAFWIETDEMEWFAFGDNYNEIIQKRSKEVIHTFHEKEYPVVYTSTTTDSIGRYGNHKRLVPDSQIKSTYKYQELVQQEGEENLSLNFKGVNETPISEIYYQLSRENKWPAERFVLYYEFEVEVEKTNRWIYHPLKIESLPENALKPVLQYDVMNRKLLITESSQNFVKSKFKGWNHFTISVDKDGRLEMQKENETPKLWGENFLYVFKSGNNVVMINKDSKAWTGSFSDLFSSYSVVKL